MATKHRVKLQSGLIKIDFKHKFLMPQPAQVIEKLTAQMIMLGRRTNLKAHVCSQLKVVVPCCMI